MWGQPVAHELHGDLDQGIHLHRAALRRVLARDLEEGLDNSDAALGGLADSEDAASARSGA